LTRTIVIADTIVSTREGVGYYEAKYEATYEDVQDSHPVIAHDANNVIQRGEASADLDHTELQDGVATGLVGGITHGGLCSGCGGFSEAAIDMSTWTEILGKK
jgi:hypothetical protein